MDPATLAAGAVGALVPYLAEAGKELAKKAGGAAWEGAGKLWTLLRSKLTRPEQQSALADLETHPDNKNVQGAAIWQLEKALAEDAELAGALAESAGEPAGVGRTNGERGGRQQRRRPGGSRQQRQHHALSMAVRAVGVSPQRTRSSSSASRARPVRIT